MHQQFSRTDFYILYAWARKGGVGIKVLALRPSVAHGPILSTKFHFTLLFPLILYSACKVLHGLLRKKRDRLEKRTYINYSYNILSRIRQTNKGTNQHAPLHHANHLNKTKHHTISGKTANSRAPRTQLEGNPCKLIDAEDTNSGRLLRLNNHRPRTKISRNSHLRHLSTWIFILNPNPRLIFLKSSCGSQTEPRN